MNIQVGKWGNSLAVRIPGTYAKELDLEEGTDVEVIRVDGGLLLRPRKREYKLEDLLAQIKPERPFMANRTAAPPSGAKRGERAHAPDAGDLIWLSFTPHAGRG